MDGSKEEEKGWIEERREKMDRRKDRWMDREKRRRRPKIDNNAFSKLS